jgi:hypothetical protein
MATVARKQVDRGYLTRLVMALAISLLMTPQTGHAQVGGLEPDLSGKYGEANVDVTWVNEITMYVSVEVTDTAYDGWCAVVWLYTEDALQGGIGEAEFSACGVGTTTAEFEVVTVQNPILGDDATVALYGVYPPSDDWDEVDSTRIDNPWR